MDKPGPLPGVMAGQIQAAWDEVVDAGGTPNVVIVSATRLDIIGSTVEGLEVVGHYSMPAGTMTIMDTDLMADRMRNELVRGARA